MSKRNENKPGYKKTELGWIPKSWNVSCIGSACQIRNDLRLPLSTETRKGIQGIYPYYGPTGILDYLDHYRIEGTYALIAEDGDHFLKYTKKPMTMLVSGKFNANNHTHLIEGTDLCSTDWFYLYFLHRNIGKYTTRQGAGRYKLNKNALQNIPICLPPHFEQKKITSILFHWDEAINQMRKLIDAKKRRKKALMQQLLTGKKQLPGFNKPWEEYRLGELFNERKESNYENLMLLAITGSSGVIPATEIKRKDSSNADKSKYKRIAPGDIGYNTMRMWQGVSAVSDLEGIVSPAYTICTPKGTVDVHFMGVFFKFSPVVNLFRRFSQGLVSDTLNLKFRHFAQIKVKIPCLYEQQAISKILRIADDEIKTIEKKLAALEKQKRGLMQKLLTGEVCVKI